MKLLKPFLSLFLVILLSSHAYANTYGVINTKKILEEAQVVIYLQKKINDKQKKYQSIITKKQDLIEKEKESIIAKKDILSNETLIKEEKKFQEKVLKFKDYVTNKEKILKDASLDAMKIIQKKIEESIAEVSQKNKLTIVFPESQVVFYDDKFDITNDVLTTLNSKIRKVKVKFNDK